MTLENNSAEVIPEVSATEEKPVAEPELSATEFLQKGVAKIEGESVEETPEVETEKAPETEEKPSVTEEETEKIDETGLLKKAGFTQKSLADIKEDMNKARTQAELFNFLANNVDGFGDFLTQQIIISRGLKPKDTPLTLGDIGKREPEQPQVNTEKLLEKFTQEQIDDFRELITEMAPELGFVKRTDLEAEKVQTQKTQAEDKAVGNLKDFGVSGPVKEQLKALNLNWETDVKPAIVGMLLEDFGINDFANVTPKNITRAYNVFMQEKQGGIEKLLSNVKSEATKEHEEKLKLGQVVPKSGQPAIKPDFDLEKFLSNPNTTGDMIKERMRTVVGKRR